jgi:RNA polymerase sigma factor (sigma-70 family)
MLTDDPTTHSDVSRLTPDDGSWSFEDLFHAEKDRLYQAMVMLTGNRQEAEDLMQDAFVRVFERWDRVSSVEDPIGYLYRTAMNGFRSHYRRSALALRRAVPPRDRRDDIARADRHLDLTRRLALLTKKQRTALVLTDFLELSSEEAAEAMGLTPGAVRTQASRARTQLRKAVGDDDA